MQDASKALPSTTNDLDALLSTVPSPPASSNAASRVGVLFRPRYRAIMFELKLKHDMPFKLRDTLVSKEYFRAAAQAWFRAVVFHARTLLIKRTMSQINSKYLILQRHLHRKTKLFLKFGKVASIEMGPSTGFWLQYLRRCGSLKRLTVDIGYEFFWRYSLGPSPLWQTILDEELFEILRYSGMSRLRGLKTIKLQPLHSAVQGPAHRAIFKGNVQRLEHLAQRQVSMAKQDSRVTLPADDIFSGPRFHFENSAKEKVAMFRVSFSPGCMFSYRVDWLQKGVIICGLLLLSPFTFFIIQVIRVLLR